MAIYVRQFAAMTDLDPPTEAPRSARVIVGPLGQVRYATAYFASLEPSVRRAQLTNWAVKPGLPGRALRYAFPRLKRRPSSRFNVNRLRRAPEIQFSPIRSWADARQRNLDEVLSIMTAADIDHVVIDDGNASRSQVAIDVADGARWIEAFERHGKDGLVLAARPWTDRARLTAGGQQGASRRLMRRRVAMGTSFVVCRYRHLGASERVFGLAYGTVISLWERHEDDLGPDTVRGSAPNRWARSLVIGPEREATESPLSVLRAELPRRRHVNDVDIPIDLVFLWVDGDDPEWMERRNTRLEEVGRVPDGRLTDEAAEERLYRSRDELKFALRSVEMWAPFVNHVFLVTDRQIPTWYREAEGLTVIDHTQILPTEALPTFNSNAIDTGLHRIPGLSEHFLVTNDDMMFIGASFAEDFFAPGGVPRIFPSKARIPLGDEESSAPAVDSASRRNRELIADRHGVMITQKFKHIMIPQTRSLRFEVEGLYDEAVSGTARRPFRDHRDVSFSHLCLYEGLATGRAALGSLPYDYVSLGSKRMGQALDRIRSAPGRLKVLCINDSDSEIVLDDFGRPIGEIEIDQNERDAIVSEFMEAVFPVPSSWEADQIVPTQQLNKENSS